MGEDAQAVPRPRARPLGGAGHAQRADEGVVVVERGHEAVPVAGILARHGRDLALGQAMARRGLLPGGGEARCRHGLVEAVGRLQVRGLPHDVAVLVDDEEVAADDGARHVERGGDGRPVPHERVEGLLPGGHPPHEPADHEIDVDEGPLGAQRHAAGVGEPGVGVGGAPGPLGNVGALRAGDPAQGRGRLRGIGRRGDAERLERVEEHAERDAAPGWMI